MTFYNEALDLMRLMKFKGRSDSSLPTNPFVCGHYARVFSHPPIERVMLKGQGVRDAKDGLHYNIPEMISQSDESESDSGSSSKSAEISSHWVQFLQKEKSKVERASRQEHVTGGLIYTPGLISAMPKISIAPKERRDLDERRARRIPRRKALQSRMNETETQRRKRIYTKQYLSEDEEMSSIDESEEVVYMKNDWADLEDGDTRDIKKWIKWRWGKDVMDEPEIVNPFPKKWKFNPESKKKRDEELARRLDLEDTIEVAESVPNEEYGVIIFSREIKKSYTIRKTDAAVIVYNWDEFFCNDKGRVLLSQSRFFDMMVRMTSGDRHKWCYNMSNFEVDEDVGETLQPFLADPEFDTDKRDVPRVRMIPLIDPSFWLCDLNSPVSGSKHAQICRTLSPLRDHELQRLMECGFLPRVNGFVIGGGRSCRSVRIKSKLSKRMQFDMAVAGPLTRADNNFYNSMSMLKFKMTKKNLHVHSIYEYDDEIKIFSTKSVTKVMADNLINAQFAEFRRNKDFELTPINIEIYKKGRHNELNRIIARFFGCDEAGDIAFTRYFSNDSKLGQTPDILINLKSSLISDEDHLRIVNYLVRKGLLKEGEEDKLVWLVGDSAFSDNPNSVGSMKFMTYSGAMERLKRLSREKGKDEVHVFLDFHAVATQKTMTNIDIFPPKIRAKINEYIKEMHKLQAKMSARPAYKNLYYGSNLNLKGERVKWDDLDVCFSKISGFSADAGFDPENADREYSEKSKALDETLEEAKGQEPWENHKATKSLIESIVMTDELFVIPEVNKLYQSSLIDKTALHKQVRNRKKELAERGYRATYDEIDDVPTILKKPAPMIFGTPGTQLELGAIIPMINGARYLEDKSENLPEGTGIFVSNDKTIFVDYADEKHKSLMDAERKRPGMQSTWQHVERVQRLAAWAGSTDDQMCDHGKNMVKNLLETAERAMDPTIVENIVNLNVIKYSYFIQTIAREIAYNDIRKVSSSEQNEHVTVGRHRFIIRDCGDFWLIIHPGKPMSQDDVIRYMIITNKPQIDYDNTDLHRAFHDYSSDFMGMTREQLGGLCEPTFHHTGWLTMSQSDWEDDMRMGDENLLILYEMYSTARETGMDITFDDEYLMYPLLFNLEERRTTSNANQLNRYLMHSHCSFITDTLGLINKIGEAPIRSVLQSFVAQCQLNWIDWSVEHKCDFQSGVKQSFMKREESGYDRHYIRSFYSKRMVEMDLVMYESYYVCLFNASAGHHGHRIKEVVQKMSEDEKIWRENCHKPQFKGIIPGGERGKKIYLMDKQEQFQFSAKDVHSYTKMMFEEKLHSIDLTKLTSKWMACITDMCTMKSSLYGSPVFTKTDLQFLEREIRKKLYDTQREIQEEIGIVHLLEYVNSSEFFELIWALFEKAQLGGPREIFIMDMYSRIHLRMIESTFEFLCENLDTEMLTSGVVKHLTQENIRDKLEEKLKMGDKKIRAVMSYNKDKTHWGPGMNMMNYLTMIDACPFPKSMKDYMKKIVEGFMSKRVLMPESLKSKMEKYAKIEKEDPNPSVAYYYEKNQAEDYAMFMNSGMGQGMLHYLSSFYHAVAAYADKKILSELTNGWMSEVDIQMETQLSSDDRTDYILIQTNDADSFNRACFLIEGVQTLIGKLFNLEQNYKKSGMSLILHEFNSVFMLGKRILTTPIKDLKTSMIVPDCTVIEQSVKELMSCEQRLFSAGLKEDTLILARCLNRIFLMDLYKITDLEGHHMSILCINNPDALPIAAGYLPTSHVLESLIAGAEIYPKIYENEGLMKNFYAYVYSGDAYLDFHPAAGKVISDLETVGKRGLKSKFMVSEKIRKMMSEWHIDPSTVRLEAEENYFAILEGPRTLSEVTAKLDLYLATIRTHFLDTENFRLASVSRALSAARFQLIEFGTKEMAEKTTDITGFIKRGCEFDRSINDVNPLSHYMFKVFEYFCSSSSRARKELKTCILDEKRVRHLKIRSVNFRSPSTSFIPSKRQVIDALEDPLKIMNTATKNILNHMTEEWGIQIGLDFKQTATMTFPESETPQLDLDMYLEKISGTKVNLRTIMPFEEPDAGDYYGNFFSILRHRSSRRGIYQKPGFQEFVKDVTTQTFISNFLISESPMDKWEEIRDHYGMNVEYIENENRDLNIYDIRHNYSLMAFEDQIEVEDKFWDFRSKHGPVLVRNIECKTLTGFLKLDGFRMTVSILRDSAVFFLFKGSEYKIYLFPNTDDSNQLSRDVERHCRKNSVFFSSAARSMQYSSNRMWSPLDEHCIYSEDEIHYVPQILTSGLPVPILRVNAMGNFRLDKISVKHSSAKKSFGKFIRAEFLFTKGLEETETRIMTRVCSLAKSLISMKFLRRDPPECMASTADDTTSRGLWFLYKNLYNETVEDPESVIQFTNSVIDEKRMNFLRTCLDLIPQDISSVVHDILATEQNIASKKLAEIGTEESRKQMDELFEQGYTEEEVAAMYGKTIFSSQELMAMAFEFMTTDLGVFKEMNAVVEAGALLDAPDEDVAALGEMALENDEMMKSLGAIGGKSLLEEMMALVESFDNAIAFEEDETYSTRHLMDIERHRVQLMMQTARALYKIDSTNMKRFESFLVKYKEDILKSAVMNPTISMMSGRVVVSIMFSKLIGEVVTMRAHGMPDDVCIFFLNSFLETNKQHFRGISPMSLTKTALEVKPQHRIIHQGKIHLQNNKLIDHTHKMIDSISYEDYLPKIQSSSSGESAGSWDESDRDVRRARRMIRKGIAEHGVLGRQSESLSVGSEEVFPPLTVTRLGSRGSSGSRRVQREHQGPGSASDQSEDSLDVFEKKGLANLDEIERIMTDDSYFAAVLAGTEDQMPEISTSHATVSQNKPVEYNLDDDEDLEVQIDETETTELDIIPDVVQQFDIDHTPEDSSAKSSESEDSREADRFIEKVTSSASMLPKKKLSSSSLKAQMRAIPEDETYQEPIIERFEEADFDTDTEEDEMMVGGLEEMIEDDDSKDYSSDSESIIMDEGDVDVYESESPISFEGGVNDQGEGEEESQIMEKSEEELEEGVWSVSDIEELVEIEEMEELFEDELSESEQESSAHHDEETEHAIHEFETMIIDEESQLDQTREFSILETTIETSFEEEQVAQDVDEVPHVESSSSDDSLEPVVIETTVNESIGVISGMSTSDILSGLLNEGGVMVNFGNVVAPIFSSSDDLNENDRAENHDATMSVVEDVNEDVQEEGRDSINEEDQLSSDDSMGPPVVDHSHSTPALDITSMNTGSILLALLGETDGATAFGSVQEPQNFHISDSSSSNPGEDEIEGEDIVHHNPLGNQQDQGEEGERDVSREREIETGEHEVDDQEGVHVEDEDEEGDVCLFTGGAVDTDEDHDPENTPDSDTSSGPVPIVHPNLSSALDQMTTSDILQGLLAENSSTGLLGFSSTIPMMMSSDED